MIFICLFQSKVLLAKDDEDLDVVLARYPAEQNGNELLFDSDIQAEENLQDQLTHTPGYVEAFNRISEKTSSLGRYILSSSRLSWIFVRSKDQTEYLFSKVTSSLEMPAFVDMDTKVSRDPDIGIPFWLPKNDDLLNEKIDTDIREQEKIRKKLTENATIHQKII